MRLNVTKDADGVWWWGYVVINGAAYKVAYGDLDDLREYASANDYSGILIGAPSVPFFQAIIYVKV